MTQLLSLPDVSALACDCLTRAGVPDPVARAVAAEVAAAEGAGERRHGMEALLRDIRLLRYGRLHGKATAVQTRPRPGMIHIDAHHGFAAAALAGAIDPVAQLAAAQGIAMARLDRASAPGAMIRAMQPLADRGLIALAFGATGPGRIAHPGLGRPAALKRPADVPIPPLPMPTGLSEDPPDSPFGGLVSHSAWLVAMTGETAGAGLLEAEIWDSGPPPPATHEIAFPVDLLEQIVTA